MNRTPWWKGATPHNTIQTGKIKDGVFAANLGQAIRGTGTREYHDPGEFFAKTYITKGLRSVLVDSIKVLAGDTSGDRVWNLKSSFGGGKTHAILALYHLIKNHDQLAKIPYIAEIIAEAQEDIPPAVQTAVFAGSDIDPLEIRSEGSLSVQTLWGEIAYQLGGTEGYSLLKEFDKKGISPGAKRIGHLLERYAPCAILIDETLHYVDKVSRLTAERGNLAEQTVAFVQELTEAVVDTPKVLAVVSLTASQMDQLGVEAQNWLSTLDQHIRRLSQPRFTIEKAEIQEIIRLRLFNTIDGKQAEAAANRYVELYKGVDDIPVNRKTRDYKDLLARSYPFHPELISILYDGWGSKPTFQLTRGTLRFLSLLLAKLWEIRSDNDPDLILPGMVDLRDTRIRANVRDSSGDPAWETVIAADIAGTSAKDNARAELLYADAPERQRLSREIATTVLMYSLGGQQLAHATRMSILLCTLRPGSLTSEIDDTLGRFKHSLYYYYYSEEDRHYFAKEPNVVALWQQLRDDLKGDPAIDQRLEILVKNKAMRVPGGMSGFSEPIVFPTKADDIPDTEVQKLVALSPAISISTGEIPDTGKKTLSNLISSKGQLYRDFQNTITFVAADANSLAHTRDRILDYLAWKKIEESDQYWSQIGASQKEIVADRRRDSDADSIRQVRETYSWIVVPKEKGAFRIIKTGNFAPGEHVPEVVWQKLTDEHSPDQSIFTHMTAHTFEDRYRSESWKKGQQTTTTRSLWERFAKQLSLPKLASESVLLRMLREGEEASLWGIGELETDSSPVDQRKSYLSLYQGDMSPGPNVPGMGQRWVAIDNGLFKQLCQTKAITVAVNSDQLLSVVQEILSDKKQKSVSVAEVVKQFEVANPGTDIDRVSVLLAIKDAAGRGLIECRTEKDMLIGAGDVQTATVLSMIPRLALAEAAPKGTVAVTAAGEIELTAIAPLYKELLQPLKGQGPKSLKIKVSVYAVFDAASDSVLDTIVEEARAKGDLKRIDIRKTQI